MAARHAHAVCAKRKSMIFGGRVRRGDGPAWLGD
jgi:hypothetical protein